MKNKIIKAAINTIKAIVSIAIIYFLADAIIKNWDKINFNELTINWTYLLLALIPFILHIFLYAAIWKKLLTLVGTKISFIEANNIYANSQFWRYIPGRVMLFVRRIMLCTKKGISNWDASLSIILELTALLISAVATAIFTSVFWPNTPSSTKIIFAALSITIIVATIFIPKFSKLITSLIQKFMKVKNKNPTIHYENLPWILLAYALTWTLQGTGLYLIAASVYDAPLTLLPVCIGIFAISWVVGFMGILTPGGVGIREGVLILLAAPFMPTNIIIITAVISRIYITLAEIIFWTVNKTA